MNEKMNKKLAEALTQISEEIPSVNHGGCGIVAYELSKALSKKGVRSSIIEIGSLSHIVVKVGDAYFDADGLYAIGRSQLHHNAVVQYSTDSTRRISRKELRETIDCADLWNPEFDRSEYVEDLKAIVRYAVDVTMSAEINYGDEASS